MQIVKTAVHKFMSLVETVGAGFGLRVNGAAKSFMDMPETDEDINELYCENAHLLADALPTHARIAVRGLAHMVETHMVTPPTPSIDNVEIASVIADNYTDI